MARNPAHDMTVFTDIVVSSGDWGAPERWEELVERAVRQCVAIARPALMPECEVCVVFCDDAEIRALNAQWRGKDKPTNVLSFETPGPLDQRPLLGDIVVAYETVAREAAEQEKSFADHAAHMVVHGFLHLIGYDHETSAEAEIMEALERRVAEVLGLPDPYEGTHPVDETDGSRGADVDET
jgi:probable rRNA maturation factor